MASRGAGNLVSGRVVPQVFRVPAKHLAVISLKIGTYRAVQTSHFVFRLYELKSTPTERLLRSIAKFDLLHLR
jgi:hypothetical protein